MRHELYAQVKGGVGMEPVDGVDRGEPLRHTRGCVRPPREEDPAQAGVRTVTEPAPRILCREPGQDDGHPGEVLVAPG